MKTAVIIGATSGIGREVAIRLIEEGWKVGIAGRRLERLLDLRGKYGSEQVACAAIDINRADAAAALDTLLEQTGPPDLFLHVSGIGGQNPKMDEAKELQILETNCLGMTRMVAHFINYVKAHPVYDKRHKARIGVVTSVAGTDGLGISAAYSASKRMQITYLTALSQLVRMEGLPIRFSDIRPGFVQTDILDPAKHHPFLMSVERAGDYVMKGLRRKRRIVIFDWRYRLLTGLWRLIPRALWERLTIIKLG